MSIATRLPSRRTLLGAVARRDPAWDGLFIVAVRTTGVACRPVCPSRRAREEHLEFFPTLDAARHAGYRPCRRCRPDQARSVPGWWPTLVRLVDSAGAERIPDAALRREGLNPVQVRRHFRRTQHTTFHAWIRARRLAEAQRRLRKGDRLDTVIVDSAWESHSGFRDAFSRVVGAPPGQARSGEPVTVNHWHSPLGPMILGATDAGAVLLEFGDMSRLEKQGPSLRRWFKGPIVAGEHRHLDTLRGELERYFAGELQRFTVPLVLRGTPFELAVWSALREIPFGETRSYRDIAVEIGNPRAVRAVGSANGRNRLVVVVPCHRVVNADGKLGGYGGGLWRKVRLLEIEGVRH